MSSNDIARVYASSLVEVAQKKGNLETVDEEFKFVAELFQGDKDFNNFLTNPSVSRNKKKGLIDNVFQKSMSSETVNFLKLLVENDRQSFVPEIMEALNELMDDIQNRIRVTITTSSELDAGTRKTITGELKKKYDREIVLSEKVDTSILGGIIIKIGDLVIDGSLAKDLKHIRNKLISSTIRSDAAYEN